MNARAGLVVLLIAAAGEAQPALNPGLAPAPVLRTTPHESLLGYLEACGEGDWATAAHYLWLNHLAPAQQRSDGPVLARHLYVVLEGELRLDLGRVSDEPAGNPDEPGVGPDEDQLAVVALGPRVQPIRLTHVRGADWVFARGTVEAIGRMYAAHGHGWLGEHVPEWLSETRVLDLELWQLLGVGVALVLALVLGRLALWLVLLLGVRVLRKAAGVPPGDELRARVRGPLGLLLNLLVLSALLRPLRLPLDVHDTLATLIRTGVLLSATWFVARFVNFGARLLESSLARTASDDRKRRSIVTQVVLLRRVVNFFVVVIGVSLTLLQFDVVRTVGVSVLASAGLAGVILGLAAQKSMANLLAGIQISLTEPFRLGDTVTVEGDFGTIEEVELTYVVVKLWDQRRLVVPISTFIEKAFHNWTRTSPEVLGTVYLYADYSVDVEAVRAELGRILAATPLWDRRESGVQVTALSERNVELRALVSAKNPGDAWDLRCHVRERLLQWLQREQKHLPLVRVTFDRDPRTEVRPPAT